MAAIFQTTFWDAFSWMKIYELRLIFHWALFLRVQLTIFQHWFRLWLGASQATSHYLNQWWLVYRRIYASLGLNELMLHTQIQLGWTLCTAKCFAIEHFHYISIRENRRRSNATATTLRRLQWSYWSLELSHRYVLPNMCSYSNKVGSIRQNIPGHWSF